MAKSASGKTAKAAALETRDLNFYQMGVALAMDDIATEQQFQEALRACKTPRDRSALRDGFIDTQCKVRGLTAIYARRKFYALAKLYTPLSSRQRKAMAERDAAKAKAAKAADEAVGGDAEGKLDKLSDKEMSSIILRAVGKVALAQTQPPADFLAWAGELLAILNPTRKRKAKAAKAKAAPADDVDADADEGEGE
jgi:hypothetical protein